MQKKSIKATGTPLLKRLFIEQLKEAGWTPHSSDTISDITGYGNVGIKIGGWLNDKNHSFYSSADKGEIEYNLTTQFEEALEAFKSYHKLEHPVVCKWVISAIKYIGKSETISYLKEDGKYDASGYNTGWKADELLKHSHENHVIWSVKVSDTKYTVGENIVAPATHTGSKILTITGFRINEVNNNMLVLCKEFSKNGIGIENIQKAPKVYIPQIGDWVKWSGRNPVVAKVIGADSVFSQCAKLDINNGKTHDSCSYSHLRPATAEEIKEVERLQEQDVEKFAVMLSAEEIKTLREIIKKQS